MTTKADKPSEKRASPWLWKLALLLVVGTGFGGLAYYNGVDAARVVGILKTLRGKEEPRTEHGSSSRGEPTIEKPSTPWDGLVSVTDSEMAAIGFQFARVKSQAEPIRLELNGRTDFDPTTITKIRPRFDTRVERVLATLGKKIQKGDPLVELYSTDLAKAKNDFQMKYVQWRHDVKLYQLRQKLVATGAISQQLWVDTQNDEQKTRLDYKLARDYLAVFYEVPKEEIDPLIENLGDVMNPGQLENVSEKARMTLRSKIDGIVIASDVVPGNYYESTDVLMQIAPLDHLWVWVNVYELDQHMVKEGQTIDIQFPFLGRTVSGKVNYVANEVSKDTRAVRVRAVIPNPNNQFKAEMLVKALLEIPPVPGYTVIPRLAMVAINGNEYAFVRANPKDGAGPDGAQAAAQFKRVRLHVAQENTDHVIVASGLEPDQEVVTNGSLIMSQLFEDQYTLDTGLPPQ